MFSGLVLTLIVSALPAQQGTATTDGAVKVTLDAQAKWRDAKDTISKERELWREGRETLKTRIEVATREIATLTKQIEKEKGEIVDADKERDELQAEKAEFDQVLGKLEEKVGGLEERVRKMLPRLPPPLAERLKPLSQRLPESPEKAAEAKMAVVSRYQNVIVMLGDISKWNREVTIKTESRELADGKSVSVVAIYIGLGQAFYAGVENEQGIATVGGVGTATADAWIWKPANDLAPAIQKAISVYKNEQLAALVRLPVQIL